MACAADELHLRLIFQRIAELRSAAVTLVQLQQANAVRNRVAAGLVRRGWRVPEIAAAIGKTYRQVRHWYEQGRALDANGLSLPYPPAEQKNGLSPSRLTVPAVARRLRVNEATIRRWINDGYLLATRTSDASHGRWAIEAAELERLGIPEVTMTVQEAARRYRVHPLTVRVWISQGDVPAVAVHPGGVLRIPANAPRPFLPDRPRAAGTRRRGFD